MAIRALRAQRYCALEKIPVKPVTIHLFMEHLGTNNEDLCLEKRCALSRGS